MNLFGGDGLAARQPFNLVWLFVKHHLINFQPNQIKV
jgi:hypothetical protein